MKKRDFIIMAAAVLGMAACHTTEPQPAAESTLNVQEPMPQAEVLIEEARPIEVKPAKVVKSQAQAKEQKKGGKAETIYVETDGAQGRVWGHVTMKGDRGAGTIHDWDENTLTVTVTRHGNELFAVDQNTRQYVFKLKQ